MDTIAPDAPLPRYASMKEAAAYIRVHEDTISRRIADGTLTAYRFGSAVRVDLNELDRLMRQAAHA